MTGFEERGKELRSIAKSLIIDYMKATYSCQPKSEGMKLAEIFRNCGFDWGNYPKATSTHQQYWVVALVRELQKEGKVEQVKESGPWRLV
jgi:hypothetical protein